MKINYAQAIASHTIIIVPGLGDTPSRNKLYEKLIKYWTEKYHFTPIFFEANWGDIHEAFDQKLQRLLTLINSYETDAIRKVSLIGISAGGSLALNAYFQKKSKISKVINVCGRLRVGSRVYPTLEKAAKKSKAFYDSVQKCDEGLATLSNQEKTNILTLRAIFDEVVPTPTTLVGGATNYVVGSIEHKVTIGMCLTAYSNKITDFLQKE